MARVRKTVLAEQDLEEIWLYIAADNIVAADALIDKLVEKSVLLAANAELGRAPAGNPRRLAQLSGRQLHLVLSPRARWHRAYTRAARRP
jgi:plasmid stabilization system protein ParE